jgi:glycogen operon protein
VGDSWKEWNGRFRDDIRSFVKGDRGTARMLAQRMLGSPDIFGHREREPELTINFVTCHDGFTLNDLVSYNLKHNEGNGEANRDGTDDNRSWNCGSEALRRRQLKNFFVTMLVSIGTPMLLMGDEMRRTQRGNNNAYCQDNELSWVDWSLLERHAGLQRFVRTLIAQRLRWVEWTEASGGARAGWSLNELLQHAQITWHGVALGQPDWGEDSHSLACTIRSGPGRVPFSLHLMLNAYWEPLDFELPPLPNGLKNPWRRTIDTYLDSPQDIVDWDDSPVVSGHTYRAGPRSVVHLWASTAPEPGS